METKNEPKTLEEANYRLYGSRECEDCAHGDYEEYRRGIHYCHKFLRTVDTKGMCDCYE